MSFDHPSAPTNSNRQNPDPLEGARLKRAIDWYEYRYKSDSVTEPFDDFFSWEWIRQDVLHYKRFDDLPQDEQDRIRVRRQKDFETSQVPWIITDATGLLTTLDDIDDLGKSGRFLKDYAIDPASRLLDKLADRLPSRDKDALDTFRRQCDPAVPLRQKKIAVLRSSFNNVLALLGLQALKALFPSWRFLALALQLAQTTDSLFGYGLQLGPIIGKFQEALFRGLHAVGLPFDQSHNKYNQIKAARITAWANKILASSKNIHQEDALTTYVALHTASHPELMKPIIIPPSEYPDFSDMLTGDDTVPEFITDFGTLAASLPWNLAAYAVNELLGPMLANWSAATEAGGDPTAWQQQGAPTDPLRGYMELAEKGTAPCDLCDAEVYQDVSVLLDPLGRVEPGTTSPTTLLDVARDMRWRIFQRTDPDQEPDRG
jgi:hypothetical protein